MLNDAAIALINGGTELLYDEENSIKDIKNKQRFNHETIELSLNIFSFFRDFCEEPGQSEFDLLLFYSDLSYLRDTGRLFTDNYYLALENGPAPVKHKKLRQFIINKLDKNENLHDKKYNRHLSAAPWYLSKFKMDIKKFLEFSKENVGWQMSYNSGIKMNKNPKYINMNIAMQQIADE